MADEKIKLPRSSYEEISKIITAYSVINEPASLADLSKSSALPKSVISANNSFLAYIGLITGGNNKSASAYGTELGHALEHDIIDDISSTWSKVVGENDFLSKMVQAVKIRKSMDLDNFVSHIAYSAGESKAKHVLTGARTVVDILKSSSLIQEKDGAITIGKGLSSFTNKDEQDEQQKNEEISEDTPLNYSKLVNLNIELKISANPNELDGLGDKIKNLIKSLTGINNNTTK